MATTASARWYHRYVTDPELRARLLVAAEAQLVGSVDNDVATRAVCEAAGVSPPVLYRLFGDKQGLLAALVDHGYQRYLERKVAQSTTEDALADLRAGWDDHMDFAGANPAVYRLMFSPNPVGVPAARRRIFELLVGTLQRLAGQGRMALPPPLAAQAILSANVGIALNQITQPDLYDDPGLSHRVREGVFATFLVDTPPAQREGSPLAGAAVHLAAQLDLTPETPLGAEELALLRRWLDRLATPVTAGPGRTR
jgi:AcrR family transcriptional regulator